MKTKKINAQIMVIVLLLLSILSIVALTATLTAVRDNSEQVQNKKYQQYYSLGERTIFDMQRFLGNSSLNTITSGTFSLNSESGGTLSGTCTKEDNKATCEFPEIASSEVGGGLSQEKLSIITSITDTNYILNHTIQKDQDILIELTTGTNITYLLWDDAAVAWGVTYDSKDGSNNYFSQKAIFSLVSGPFGANNTGSSCVNITDRSSDNTLRANLLSQMSNPAGSFSRIIEIRTTVSGCNTALDYRIRAYSAADSEISFSLVKDANAVPLQRVITTVTSTSDVEASLQTEDNPTAVLTTSYLLVSSPLTLFDYVLRTEQGILKN